MVNDTERKKKTERKIIPHRHSRGVFFMSIYSDISFPDEMFAEANFVWWAEPHTVVNIHLSAYAYSLF